MKPREIIFEELLEKELRGEEICLLCAWADCVVRYRRGADGYNYMKYKGEEEYAPKGENEDFHRAMFDGLLITRQEYDKF